MSTQIAKYMGPTWGPPGSFRPQMGPMLAPWTLLSGEALRKSYPMMTSSNGNIFRVTGHLFGEFTGPRWIPHTKPVTRSFDVFFDLRPNKRLSKQTWVWWFETLSCSLWRHRNATHALPHPRWRHLHLASQGNLGDECQVSIPNAFCQTGSIAVQLTIICISLKLNYHICV